MNGRVSLPVVCKQGGFTLVEMMIASALGLVIMAWLTQLLIDTARINREMANTSNLLESGRFALQRLREDVGHAGYWGAFVPSFDDLTYSELPSDVPVRFPDPCLPFAAWPARHGQVAALLGMPVQVQPGAVGDSCDALLSAESSALGTDVLLLRYAQHCIAGDLSCSPASSGPLYLQVSNCAYELAMGGRFALDPNAAPYTERDCTTPAARRRFEQQIYFVRNNGRGIPSLYRSEFGYSMGEQRQLAAQELVAGVERFHVALGVDDRSQTGEAVDYNSAIAWQGLNSRTVARNRGDGTPDGPFRYCSDTTPCSIAQLLNTTVLKVYLLVRAGVASPGYLNNQTYVLGDLTVGPFNDAFKRHLFSSTLRVHNVAGRRETP